MNKRCPIGKNDMVLSCPHTLTHTGFSFVDFRLVVVQAMDNCLCCPLLRVWCFRYIFSGANYHIHLFLLSKHLQAVISCSLSDRRCILIFPSFRLSSFNHTPRRLFVDLMEPQIFMQRLIYDIKDGCFLFDEHGLI